MYMNLQIKLIIHEGSDYNVQQCLESRVCPITLG